MPAPRRTIALTVPKKVPAAPAAARADVGAPQREPAGGREELDVPTECLVFAGVPLVDGLAGGALTGRGGATAVDQCAVQDDVGVAGGQPPGQDIRQLGRLGGEH